MSVLMSSVNVSINKIVSVPVYEFNMFLEQKASSGQNSRQKPLSLWQRPIFF